MSNVKGSKISDKVALVSVHYGEAAVKKVLESMSQADQMVLKIVLDSNWYPFDLYERLLRTICKVAAGIPGEIGRAFGRLRHKGSRDRLFGSGCPVLSI